MRKRKNTYKKRSTSSKSYKSYKRAKRNSNAGMMGLILGSMVYGAGRQYLSDAVAPITQKIGGLAGDYADEVVLGVGSYFLAKGKIPLLNKIPYSKDIGKAGLTIESARVGQNLFNQVMNKNTTTATKSNNSLQLTVF